MIPARAPLVDLSLFDGLFKPLRGLRVGFIQLPGNHGDSMIFMATRQLLDAHDIDYRIVDLEEIQAERLEGDVDEILIGGGGSLGTTYRRNFNLRRQVRSLDRPITILPQTIVDMNEALASFGKVYAREQTSAAMGGGLDLYPDLALGLAWEIVSRPATGTGVYLRGDRERRLPQTRLSIGDPVDLCSSVAEYIALAGRHAHLVTDRLHFAIAGLMHGVKVTLLPGAYFKNRAMYETWLFDLGCGWLESLDGLG